MLQKLGLAGVARMLAEHSVPTELSKTRVALVLDQQHETLLNQNQIDLISRALSEHRGAAVAVTVMCGELPAESPAQRIAREAAERQAAAEQSIKNDATVADLVSDFGARVEEIRPR